jgi:cytochrome c-type biogenesis protein CcmE
VTRKRRRLVFVVLGMLVLGGATALVLAAFEDSLVFFYSPTDIATKQLPADRRVRIGGIVEAGSIARGADGLSVRFVVTDLANTIPVSYRGVLPDLFREGQGVVAEGRLANGVFQADEVLAKHDEKYMPPEVVDALKKSGRWQEGATK